MTAGESIIKQLIKKHYAEKNPHQHDEDKGAYIRHASSQQQNEMG